MAIMNLTFVSLNFIKGPSQQLFRVGAADIHLYLSNTRTWELFGIIGLGRPCGRLPRLLV